MSDTPKTVPDAPPVDQTADIARSEAYETANAVSFTAPETEPSFGPPSAADELGTLGPYRVLRELGRGGMGAVYLGFDERLKRKVALKVMLPKYAAIASSKNRFLREARAAAGITHDHIVTIYEADEHGGTPFMAMQFLQGYPLDVYLKKNPQLSLGELMRIGREMALGLAAAHSVGLVHRDIKPGNIWLEAPNGRVKILDFGLAKPTDEQKIDGELTATGVIVGTPAYMPPEQARGAKADFRADLFSLGVVLYRLACGAMPFTGDTVMAMLAAVIADDPEPVGERNPAIPEPLARLIHELMAKKPQNRPKSADEVAERLRQIELGTAAAISLPMQVIPLDSLPTSTFVPTGADPFANIDATEADVVVARPTASRSLPAMPVATKPLPKWPIALLVLFLVGLAALAPQILSIMTPKGTLLIESSDPDVEITVKQGGAVIVDKSKQREFSLKVADDYSIEMTEKEGLKLNTNKFEIIRNGKAVVKVTVQRPPAKPKGDPPTPAIPSATPIVPLAWQGPSPLDVLDAATIPAAEKFDWQPKELVGVFGTHSARHWGRGFGFAASPDGKVIATGGTDKLIRLWDATTLAPLGELIGHGGTVDRIAFSKDGNRILSVAGSASGPPEFVLWNRTDRTILQRFAWKFGDKQIGGIPFIAPDDRLLAANADPRTFEGAIRVVDLKTLATVHEFKGFPLEGFAWTALSSDGSRFATLHSNSVRVWDAKTGTQLHAWNSLKPGGDNWLAFSPDGRWLAATDGGSNEQIDLHVWDVATGQSILVKKGACNYYGLHIAFSVDGKRIALGGHTGTSTIVEVPTGRIVSKIPSKGDGYGLVAFNADGSRVVTFGSHYGVGDDGILRSYDAQTGTPAIPLPTGPIGPLTSLASSSDLSQIYSAGADRIVRAWDVRSQQSTTAYETARNTHDSPRLALLKDGKRIVVVEKAVVIRDRATGTLLETLGTELADVVDVSPDGRTVYVGTLNGRIEAYDVSASPAKALWGQSAHDNHLSTIAVSPDGRRIATGANDHRAFVWDVTGKDPKKLGELGKGGIEAGDGNVYRAAWSPDGSQVLLARGGHVQIWTAGPKTFALKDSFAGQAEGVYITRAFGVHPSLPWLAVADVRGNLILWDYAAKAKRKSWAFPASPTELRFAADGRHLLTTNANGTVYVLRIDDAKTPSDPDRRAAEGALGFKADVHILTDGAVRVFRTVGELPKTPFTLLRFDLPANAAIDDAAVRPLLTDRLLVAILTGSSVGNPTAERLAKIPTLTDLHLAQTKITDDGAVKLAALPSLKLLTVAGTGVGDRLAKALGRAAALEDVNFHNTTLGDDGVAALATCPNLATLHLSNTKLTDKGLAPLASCTALRRLTLAKTAVTEPAVKALATALPLCTIEWDGGTIGPRDANRLVATAVLSAGGKVKLDGQAEEITDITQLPAGPILVEFINLTGIKNIDASLWVNMTGCTRLTQIVAGNSSITDDALAVLVRCPKLREIHLFNTSVTDAGLAHFAARKNWYKIDFNQTAVTNAGLAYLVDNKTLWGLYFANCAKVDDGGVATIKTLTGLRLLHLKKSGISAKGIEDLSRWLPLCQIDYDGGIVKPKSEERLNRDAAEWLLARGASFGLTVGSEFIAIKGEKGETLPAGPFEVRSFQLGTGSKATDEDLIRIRALPKVDTVVLSNSNVGDAGLAHLATLPALVKLYLSDTPITDGGLKVLEGCPKLDTLHVYGTAVTEAGVKAFAAKFPKCEIVWKGGTIGPRAKTSAGLAFDGTSTAVTIPTLKFDGNLPVTIEAWITPETVTGKARHLFLFGEPGGGLGLSDKGNLGIGFFDGNAWHNDYGRSALVPGKRVHVAAVATWKKLELFLDGQSNGNKTVKLATLALLTPPALIGKHPKNAPEGHFHGTVHALRVSKGVRYAAAFTPTDRWNADADTIAQYHFDEGTGTTLTDHSGHGHTGTIVNGTWVK